MTNITPQQMRELADAHDGPNEPFHTPRMIADTLRTAADELDRLRDERDISDRRASNLRYAIENAPHPRNCDVHSGQYGRPCTCWKADAL